MICFAPAIRHPWTTERPTPPQPNTATVAPGRTAAVLIAAPTPVVTPHPTRAAALRSTSFSMGTTQIAGTTACSAMLPRKDITRTSSPPRCTRVVPSSWWPSFGATEQR